MGNKFICYYSRSVVKMKGTLETHALIYLYFNQAFVIVVKF